MESELEWRISKDPVDYTTAFDLMEKRVNQIIEGQAKQLIWILEHQPVYTGGISSADRDLLNPAGIPTVKTNRGGKYTYHGPGIKIVYVLLDLKKFFNGQPEVARFVKFLQDWIIAVLGEFEIEAYAHPKHIGVWVRNGDSEKKIAAMGIKIRKWISYHGFAINFNPDLAAFRNIIPCGISELGVTSAEEVLKDLPALTRALSSEFQDRIIKEKFYEQLAARS